jgi:hypothetical protein
MPTRLVHLLMTEHDTAVPYDERDESDRHWEVDTDQTGDGFEGLNSCGDVLWNSFNKGFYVDPSMLSYCRICRREESSNVHLGEGQRPDHRSPTFLEETLLRNAR